MPSSEPAEPARQSFITPMGIAIALCVGAIIGGIVGEQWMVAHQPYLSVGVFQVGSFNPTASTQPTESDVMSNLMSLNSMNLYKVVLSGERFPPPAFTNGMAVEEFTENVKIERVPGKPLIRVEYTANNAKDAEDAVSAIMQTYMTQLGTLGRALQIAEVPSTPVAPPFRVAPIVKGAIVGAILAQVLFIGYRGIRFLRGSND
jgi:hypothetical protein